MYGWMSTSTLAYLDKTQHLLAVHARAVMHMCVHLPHIVKVSMWYRLLNHGFLRPTTTAAGHT